MVHSGLVAPSRCWLNATNSWLLYSVSFQAYNSETVGQLRRWSHNIVVVVLAAAAVAVSIASTYWIIRAASDFQVFP